MISLVLLLQSFISALRMKGRGGEFPKPFTPAEEAEAFERFRAGDESAFAELVERNLRLVAHIMRRRFAGDREEDDLFSTGTIGLISAVHTFNPNKGKFSAYAGRCIENEILMYLRKRKRGESVSLLPDAGLAGDGGEGRALTAETALTEENRLFGEPEPSVEEKIAREEDIREARGLLRGLSERERAVLEHTFGLNGKERLKQSEIGDRLGISRSYVSRLYTKIINKLRNMNV